MDLDNAAAVILYEQVRDLSAIVSSQSTQIALLSKRIENLESVNTNNNTIKFEWFKSLQTGIITVLFPLILSVTGWLILNIQHIAKLILTDNIENKK